MKQLANPSLLLLRSPEMLTANSILLVNFLQDGFLNALSELNPGAAITAFSYNYANAEFAGKQNGISVVNGPELPQQKFDLIICYYPKSKPEAQMTLDNIRACAHPNTRLLVVGENKGGVKSVEKQLSPVSGFGAKLDSAKHCILYHFEELHPLDSFKLDDYLRRFEVDDNGRKIGIYSLPGVFNHGALDDGTALLLKNMPALPGGKALDFGCGAGVIAAVLGTRQPDLEFECIDVSALAVYSTEQTLKHNNLKGRSYLSDGLSKVEGRFDVIVSNPPFHTGLATDYSIAENFIHGAKAHLNKQGQLFIVANSFLKYPQLLADNFKLNETLAGNKRFNLYRSA